MRASVILSAAAALAVLAGCGSSKSTSSTATTSGSTATSSAASSRSAYGSGSSGATSSTTAASSSGTPAAQAVTLATKHGSAGTILAAGPKRLTVYLFEGDSGPRSACSGACAAAWPPVTSAGAVKATGGVSSAKLATVTRPDGTKQVTYNGHPLYYFAQDKDQGDSYGQGVKAFGASWYVLAPSGNKIDQS